MTCVCGVMPTFTHPLDDVVGAWFFVMWPCTFNYLGWCYLSTVTYTHIVFLILLVATCELCESDWLQPFMNCVNLNGYSV